MFWPDLPTPGGLLTFEFRMFLTSECFRSKASSLLTWTQCLPGAQATASARTVQHNITQYYYIFCSDHHLAQTCVFLIKLGLHCHPSHTSVKQRFMRCTSFLKTRPVNRTSTSNNRNPCGRRGMLNHHTLAKLKVIQGFPASKMASEPKVSPARVLVVSELQEALQVVPARSFFRGQKLLVLLACLAFLCRNAQMQRLHIHSLPFRPASVATPQAIPSHCLAAFRWSL